MNFPRRDIQRNDTSPGRNRMHSLFSLVILSEEVVHKVDDFRSRRIPTAPPLGLARAKIP